MTFEPAGQFIFTAAKKYNLHKQAASGILIQKVRRSINELYPQYAKAWIPRKFENGKLSIETTSASASSTLFMKTHSLIERINQEDLPQKVIEISIRKTVGH